MPLLEQQTGIRERERDRDKQHRSDKTRCISAAGSDSKPWVRKKSRSTVKCTKGEREREREHVRQDTLYLCSLLRFQALDSQVIHNITSLLK